MYRYSFIILLLLIVSCRKNEDALTQLAREISTYRSSYLETATAIRLNGITYGDTTLSYRGFAVSLTAAAKQEITVTATIDTTLVAQYNALYNEHNLTFDTSAFKVSFNGAFHVPVDSTAATDSLYILLNKATTLKDSTVYLIPVRLAANNGAQVKSSVVFFKMYVTTVSVDVFVNGGSNWNYSYPYSRSGSQYFGYFLSKDSNGVVTGPPSVRMSVMTGMRFPANDLHAYATTDVSDSLVKAYSTATGYTFEPFPAGTYALTKDAVTIPANTFFSRDSITVALSNYEAFQAGRYYLMGVKLVAGANDPFGAPPRKATTSFAMVSVYINN